MIDRATDSEIRGLEFAIAGPKGKPPRPQLRPGPAITVDGNDVMRVVNEAEQALAKLGKVYVRSRKLVHVVRDHSAPDWMSRPQGTPVIVELQKETLRELLGVAANWMVYDHRKEAHVPRKPPAWIADTLLAREQWDLPALEGIVDAPVLRPDGTILEKPGYDAATRLIYEPGGNVFPAMIAEPSLEDAHAAFNLLIKPFVDFPFVADSDLAAQVSYILTIVGRSAIRGNVPMFYFGAPTPGSGKGLLCDAGTVIAIGRVSEKITNTESEEEWRKRLLSVAFAAPRTLVIDNASGAFGSDALAMALTAGVITDRRLGGNEQATATIQFVTALTGNNITFVKDLGRRVIPIGIDPKRDNPEDRRGFVYPLLIEHITSHRSALYVAALTILRAYFVAGCPTHGGSVLGSFESWDALVRGAVIWVCGHDPIGGVTRIRADGDGDRDNLRALLTSWRAVFSDKAATVAKALKESGAFVPTDSQEALRSALAAYSERLSGRELGKEFQKLKGRNVSGLVLVKDGEVNAGVTWKVVG